MVQSVQMTRSISVIALTFTLQSMIFSTSAIAHEYMAGLIMIEHPWARGTPSAAQLPADILSSGTQAKNRTC